VVVLLPVVVVLLSVPIASGQTKFQKRNFKFTVDFGKLDIQ